MEDKLKSTLQGLIKIFSNNRPVMTDFTIIACFNTGCVKSDDARWRLNPNLETLANDTGDVNETCSFASL